MFKNIETEKINRPVFVFDSGVGGISVLKELIKLMPLEHFIYFGDSANAPYGTRDKSEIQELVDRHVASFIDEGCKAIVLACNTITSTSATLLRKKYPDLPIIGIEPALKPAAESKPHARVLVMATPVTLNEEKFVKLMLRFKNTSDIYTCPCEGLMEFVERGMLSGPELEAYLLTKLEPYLSLSLDAIVLGCTHYPFLKDTIQKLVGKEVRLFDGGYGTALELKRRLSENGLLITNGDKGSLTIRNSLNTDTAIRLSQYLLKLN